MADGFIKLHRVLLEKPIWITSTPEQKAILITILLMAWYKEQEWEWMGKKFKTKPGQFVTSLDSIAKTAGVSIRNVRTALVRFEKLDFLTNESTKTGRLITVVNWGLYQVETTQGDNEADKDLTKTRQRPDKDLTTNKNVKNERMKECKNKKLYAEFVSMTEIEYQKLVAEHGELATKEMIKILDNYKGQSEKNKKKYTSDYRAILNWVVKRYEEDQQKRGGTIENGGNKKQSKYAHIINSYEPDPNLKFDDPDIF